MIISHIVLSQINIYIYIYIYIHYVFYYTSHFPISSTHYPFVFVFLLMWFLLYDSDSISLRKYHFFSLFSIALVTLRAMLISVGRRVEEGSFVNNARLICYFSYFLLNLKSFHSTFHGS